MLKNQFIKKLQEKPEPVKHMIMWTVTLFIMIFIFAFWVWNFSRTINQSAGASERELSSKASNMALPSAWSAFKGQANSLFDLLRSIK